MKTGRLFVFEGPDGVGKSTIVDGFSQRLGNECTVLGFPGNETGSLGKLVYDIHHGAKDFGVEKIHPTSLQMLHVAAHIDAIHHSILPLLERGRTVILDRFWWSTWVYGLVDGIPEDVLKQIIAPELLIWRDRMPDILFLIDRETPLRDEPMQSWRKWRQAYLELHDQNEDFPSHRLMNHSVEELLDATMEITQRD